MATKRKKFRVSFTITLDAPTEIFGSWDEFVPADKLTSAAVADHVKDLEWSGGCQHPAFALHSNRNIEITNVHAALVRKPAKKRAKLVL